MQPKGSCVSTDLLEFNQYEEIKLDGVMDEDSFKKYCKKEEIMSNTNTYGSIDFSDLSWFPHLIVPCGFEAPKFEKFDEYGDPKLRLHKYCEQMAQYAENELLMVMMFRESLSKRAAVWFFHLENITCWEDLAKAFFTQYCFNPKAILDYLELGDEEEQYLIPDPIPIGENEMIVKIEEMTDAPVLPTPAKPSIEKDGHAEKPDPLPTEDLSINATTTKGDSTISLVRHCQPRKNAGAQTNTPLLQRIFSSNE